MIEELNILNINSTWLEVKLTNKHMDLLWNCIENREKKNYEHLAGNLYGSYSSIGIP